VAMTSYSHSARFDGAFAAGHGLTIVHERALTRLEESAYLRELAN